MSKKPIRERSWYPYTVAACIAVTLFVVLSRFGDFWGSVRRFIDYFTPVITAIVIAYLVSPLARFFKNRVFGRIKKEKIRHFLGTFFAFVTVLVFMAFLLRMLIPQLIDSVTAFAGNLDDYMQTVNKLMKDWGLDKFINLEEFISSSETLLATLTRIIADNIDLIISTSADAGRLVVEFFISFLLSIYILASKEHLLSGTKRLMQSILKEEHYDGLMIFLSRCNLILNRYIVYNLLDCLIIGGANAIFMAVLGMPYIGLVSFVVAVANLIPTFGPIVGAVIGAFVLFLIQPWYALAFLIFDIVMQMLDAYFIRPKLFGDSLGVSGLWILIGIFVGGRMFGVIGILLAVPAVAILDFVYQDYVLPWLDKRKQKEKEKAEARTEEEAEDPQEDSLQEP